MEEVICFFAKFFPDPSQNPERTQHHQLHQVGQPPQQEHHNRAQGQKVQHPAQQDSQHEVDPNDPVPSRHGIPEQKGRRPGPVDKVQQEGQHPQPQSKPEKPEQVIEEPQGPSQG